MPGKREPEINNLVNLVVKLELLRNKIPYSIADGSIEEVLRAIALEVDAEKVAKKSEHDFRVIRNMLYSDLRHEAILLSKLATAMRRRMSLYGRAEVSGLDYIRKRLDKFLEKMRVELGYHPRIPIHMQYWRDLQG
jgi:hypothetical protein